MEKNTFIVEMVGTIKGSYILTVTVCCKQIAFIFKMLYKMDKGKVRLFHVHGNKECIG
jgi:hypothetical protein